MIFLLIILGIIIVINVIGFCVNPKKQKEKIRRSVVNLKRNTHIIPLVTMFIVFFIYSSKMTAFSDTIAQVGEPGMGLCFFASTLCSILSIITFLLAFPRREKVRIVSIIIAVVMLLAIIGTDYFIYDRIIYATVYKPNPIVITKSRAFITTAKSMSIIHIALTAVNVLLIVTLPLYKKLLQKINTDVKVEDSSVEQIKELDVSDEE